MASCLTKLRTYTQFFASGVLLTVATSPTWAADYWTSFSGGAPSTSLPALTGALHGTTVNISNVGTNYTLLYLNNGIAWGNTNAGIYPPSFNTTSFEFVRSLNTPATIAAPSVAHIDFSQPVIDPILIFYSLDNSGVTVQGTLMTSGAPAVAAINSNQITQIDTSTLSVSGPFAGGTPNPEGCISGSRRVCGIYRFTGTYSQLSLGQFGGSDGVGFQIGASVTPTAGNDSYTGTQGVASTAIPDIRQNDTLTGAAGTTVPADASNTTVEVSGTWPAGITLDPATGAVSIDSTVAAGSYTLPYTLCDAADATNCTDGILSIQLTAPPPPPPPPIPVTTSPAPVPSLGTWTLVFLSSLLAVFGLARSRKQHRSSR
ncbi:hypothetical protein [Comamonas sp. 4034]|uniref:hypothetical protein n=1 Tax=Comamonas sp. 4034 TaxID=3156455 RepID=UPI003D21813F